MTERGIGTTSYHDDGEGEGGDHEESNILGGDSFSDEIADRDVEDVGFVGSDNSNPASDRKHEQGNEHEHEHEHEHARDSGSRAPRQPKAGPRRWRKQHWIIGGAIVLAFVAGVVVSSIFLGRGNDTSNNHYNGSGGQQHSSISSSKAPGGLAYHGNGGSGTSNNSNLNQHFNHPTPHLTGTSGDHHTPNNHDSPSPDDNGYHNGGSSSVAEDEHRVERERHFTALAIEWSGEVALADPNSPARMAVDWILDDDPLGLEPSARTLDVQQRYIAAVLYFATRGNQWSSSAVNNPSQHRHHHRRGRRRTRTRRRQLETQQPSANFLRNRDVCHWKTFDEKSGIFCDEEGAIVKLTLREFGLSGTLPRELWHLKKLTSINFEDNEIAGTIPSEYGLLVNLERIGLENNQITGTIPKEFSNLEKLMELDLDENYLTGHLPTHLSGLESIETIEIAGSHLTGPLPAEFFNLNDSLQKLVLKGNKFYGSIPSELGTLTKLTYLDLENNVLTGSIPIELSHATSLKTVYLNGNDFAGSLDDAFCNNQAGHTFEVLVADCQGALPEVKCSCCTSCCNALGEKCAERPASVSVSVPTLLPTSFPTPSMAKPFALLEGTTAKPVATPPHETSVNSAQLKEILVDVSEQGLLDQKHSNQFKAFMWMVRMDPSPVDTVATPHHEILQKYVMVLLYISTNGREWKNQNSFLTDTGTGVCGWDGLECNDENKIVSINLESNRLNGTLVSEIGALGPSLRDLKLGSNMLFGGIPSELGLLPGLRTLDLSENVKLDGTIPSQLSAQSLPNLKTLEIAGTGLRGNLDPLFCSLEDDQASSTIGDGDDDDDDEGGTDIRANCLDASVTCSCCLVCCDAAGRNCRTT